MSSNGLKPILKQTTYGLADNVTKRPISKAEALFDRLVVRKCDTYSGKVRKPLSTVTTNQVSNQRPFDSSISEESDDQNDNDFQPSAKTSRTRVKRNVDKRRNRVNFAQSFDKRVDKKTQMKKTSTKKTKDYPNCTKEALLKAFESAGLPDYEEIARYELHVTNAKDHIKAVPPTPPIEKILEPFERLVEDWEADQGVNEYLGPNGDPESNETQDSNETQIERTLQSKKKTKTSSKRQTKETMDSMDVNNDLQSNDIPLVSDIHSVPNQKQSRKEDTINTTLNRLRGVNTKPKYRTEIITTAALGGTRSASTPVIRRHNLTLKNVSPIESIPSPEVDLESKKPKVSETDQTFVAPLPPNKKSIKVSKLKNNCPLNVIEPSFSDLQKVIVGSKPQNRSKQISRSLINVSKPCIDCKDSEQSTEESDGLAKTAIKNSTESSDTIVHNNTKNTETIVNSNLFESKSTRSLRSTSHMNSLFELSSVFNPNIKSTPLLVEKRKQLSKHKIEFLVNSSHFDASMAKMCRSNSASNLKSFPLKTTIIRVLNVESAAKTVTKKGSKRTSNAYHLYRKSISSVHDLYNKTCQPFRTVVSNDDQKSMGAQSLRSDSIVRTHIQSKEDLKQFLDKTLSQTMFSELKVVFDGKQTTLSAKEKVLLMCEPNEVLDFKTVFEDNDLNSIRKIGEGSYGEVFGAKDSTGSDVVIKVIALVNSDDNLSEEDLFSQILPELVISKEFNRLKGDLIANRAHNFIDLLKATTVRGKYPSILLKEWDVYHKRKGSENEDPRIYTRDQLYIILVLGNGGIDLESYKFKSAVESLSVFAQLALALAAGEQEFEFEHRDMHWGNVLITTTSATQLTYLVNGVDYTLKPNGVFASLIDFSLSRMSSNGFTIYDDLAKYSDLFEGRGDYQFDVYRLMRAQNGNNWQHFEPKSNIFWLHYMLEKSINSKKYLLFRSKCHKKSIQLMTHIFNDILRYTSVTQLIESQLFSQYLSHLESN